MAPMSLIPLSSSLSSLIQTNTNLLQLPPSLRTRRATRSAKTTVASKEKEQSTPSSKSTTRLVTFLGKGGSGKTTCAVLAAQFYAKNGLKTCLVIHSQDPTAEYLMGCKIGTAPTVCMENLSAVRLETTKMLLEPLHQLKQADTRLKLTQGVLEGVVGEELGVLPGMDSIFTALVLEKLIGFSGMTLTKSNPPQEKFDIIIYDGISNEETLRMIGTTERARWYLKYLRNVAEKTDIGRLSAPSLLRLIDEAMRLNSIGGIRLNSNMSAEIWDDVDRMLERVSASFLEPSKFGCYLVMNPNNPISVKSALRYWGCAIQSGANVSGVVGFSTQQSDRELAETVENNFSPLSFAFMPYLSTFNQINKDGMAFEEDVQDILSTAASNKRLQPPVKFDNVKKSVTLFMPGFDKSEIKLYQYRGGSELLVEAGDQRRVIRLPPRIQGKVAGARFMDKNLIVTMR